MAISIRTNISSMAAQASLTKNQSSLEASLNRLSSGYRITKAGDDAAGLAISEKLRAQINGLNQATRNANDSISMIQTAEGAMQEIHTMMQRMRELAVQASNDTLSLDDRVMINSELQQLKAEVNGISDRTKFNGMALLNGSMVTTQDSTSTALIGNVYSISGGTGTVTNISVKGAKSNETYTLSAGTASNELVLTRGSDNVSQTISVADIAENNQSTLEFAQLGISVELQAATGGKTGDGIAADLAGQTIVTSTGNGSANYQIGSEAGDFINVSFDRTDINAANTGDMATLDAALASFNTASTVANSQTLIAAVDGAIDNISQKRSDLGAYQNRIEHTIANLGTTSQNLAASESRIRDVDVAAETALMTRQQILMQAAVSVLSQANQSPQLALKLLGG